MSGDQTKPMTGKSLAANLVQSLDSAGFTVGDDDRVNDSGTTYQWVAMVADGLRSRLGTYTGTGSNQAITRVGFRPEAVFTVPEGGDEVNVFMSGMSMGYQVDLEAGNVNRLASLDADGFTLGTAGQTNGSGKTFAYLAFNATGGRVAQLTYTGNGTSQTVSATIAPAFVFLRADTNGITAFGATSFTVSSGDDVNKSGILNAALVLAVG